MEKKQTKSLDDPTHLVQDEEKVIGARKTKKIPLHDLFKFLGASDELLEEASKRYSQGFFANLKFIVSYYSKVFLDKGPAGKVAMVGKLLMFPSYQVIKLLVNKFQKEFKALNSKIVNDGPKKEFMENGEEVTIEDLKHKPQLFQHIINPSLEMQKAAVSIDGELIRFIKDPSFDLLAISVSENCRALQYIENCPQEIVLNAISKDYSAIAYVKGASEELKLMAVDASSLALEFIKDPSEEVSFAAVKRNGMVLKDVISPSERVIDAAIANNPYSIAFVNNPSELQQLAAVKSNSNSIKYINDPLESVKIAAVSVSGEAVRYIKNPSDQVILAALHSMPDAYSFVVNPRDEIIIEAIKRNSGLVDFVTQDENEARNLLVKAGYLLVKNGPEYGFPDSFEVKVRGVNWKGEEGEYVKEVVLTDHLKDVLSKNGEVILTEDSKSGNCEVLKMDQKGFLYFLEDVDFLDKGDESMQRNISDLVRTDKCTFHENWLVMNPEKDMSERQSAFLERIKNISMNENEVCQENETKVSHLKLS